MNKEAFTLRLQIGVTHLSRPCVIGQGNRYEIINGDIGCPQVQSDESANESEEHRKWRDLVQRVRAREAAALVELYKVLRTSPRIHLARRVGAQDLEDSLHDLFLVVVKAIQQGELRDPTRLMGFVKTVTRRLAVHQVWRRVRSRQTDVDLDTGRGVPMCDRDPEQSFSFEERRELIKRVLNEMSPTDRELLKKYYLLEQGQEQIRAEMGLTETQFRLAKSRAKARFGVLGKKKLGRANFVRVSAA